MAEAEVGDDVYGEDPTVNRLQDRAAEMFGREAALFVPSGSMGNLICVRIHTQHGSEVICESRGHTFNFENASLSAVAGCLARPVKTENGVMTWDDIEPAVPPKAYYRAQTALVVLENTHNMAGGTVFPPEIQDDVCDRAHRHEIPVHLDGARIFNAAAATGRSVAELTRRVDSIMFCLSKGLGAPIGSLILGSREFIEKAWVFRKMFGGRSCGKIIGGRNVWQKDCGRYLPSALVMRSRQTLSSSMSLRLGSMQVCSLAA
jgi:threonine aldolase